MPEEEYISNKNSSDNDKDLILIFYRFLSFWPFFLISILFFLVLSFIYLRYVDYDYLSTAKIEIIDKSQDSEMALPTAMTIFNRSMINLENELGVLNSFSLHRKVVESLKSNIKFYSVGRIKTTENHPDEWFEDYEFSLKIKHDTIRTFSSYEIYVRNDKLIIDHYDTHDELINSYDYDKYSTIGSDNGLPFDLDILSYNDLDIKRIVRFYPINDVIEDCRKTIKSTESGVESDQIDLSYKHPNPKIANDYLNSLIFTFDKDGVNDRQLEYKRTIEFVDSRSSFLNEELKLIELSKQEFKQKNNLSDIELNANVTFNQQVNYNSEIFKAKSQRDLVSLLKETLKKNEFKLMPVDIGIENNNINELINEFNQIIKERDKFLISAGKNNLFVKNLEKQINNYSENIASSIDGYLKNLDVLIENLKIKEKEFTSIYNDIPENEKILRSIERELKIKESLFLLLLQKREEAAINLAVVKPSIKIIDSARNTLNPVFPNKLVTLLISILIALILPFLIISIRFYFDTKIHTREQLTKKTNDIPIIAEIPHISNKSDLNTVSSASSRSPLAESIRMLTANLNFNINDKNTNQTILVTSSIKGEGKTLVSINAAAILSTRGNKVLLIGADLRNPQLHKYLKIDKKTKGISDYIYSNDLNFEDLIIKKDNFEILLSGTIPPNPTELLTSDRFGSFMSQIKSKYDYVIIDSAPCLLVSDTFEISKFTDKTVYVVRSNYSDVSICNYINEIYSENKLSNIYLVLNSVGNSTSYGYKYGYQYGYQYGYKYGYNYGYGYGYSEDRSD